MDAVADLKARGVVRGRGSLDARRCALAAAVLLALASLVLVVDPRALATAVGRFDGREVLPLVVLSAAYYALQGIRWHLLLRHIGVRGGMADSVVTNLAGQAMTAIVPLGDLTRALLIARSSGVRFGAAAATVTVQELTFTLCIVAAAAPGLVHLPAGGLLITVVLGGIAATVAVLTVAPVFAQTRRLLARLPGGARLLPEVDALQHELPALLRHPATLLGSLLDLARVAVAVAALLLILRGLHVDSAGWWQAALVLGVSFVGGALSFLPGGVGANEAGLTGVLVLLGVHPVAAAAAALIQRAWFVALPTVGGSLAYLHLRRLAGDPGRTAATAVPQRCRLR